MGLSSLNPAHNLPPPTPPPLNRHTHVPLYYCMTIAAIIIPVQQSLPCHPATQVHELGESQVAQWPHESEHLAVK